MWKTVNYEARGRSHIKSDIPCQDKTITLKNNDITIIALADGAGSAGLSHFGADAVIKAAGEYICNNFYDIVNNADGKQVKLNVLEYLLGKLRDLSNELSCDMQDLASTLLLVAANSETFLMLHIGDGVIGYLKNNELKVASMPENGEFANTTTFVTSKAAISSMKLFKGEVNDIAGFVLMSDGSAESFYHKRTKSLASVLIKLMHRNCLISNDRMKEMVKDSFDKIIVTNTQDDCSIAIMSRRLGDLYDYASMSVVEKADLLGIRAAGISISKRIKRYDEILYRLENPESLDELSRALHLKSKYTLKHLNRLMSIGLIVRDGNRYSRVMDPN